MCNITHHASCFLPPVWSTARINEHVDGNANKTNKTHSTIDMFESFSATSKNKL